AVDNQLGTTASGMGDFAEPLAGFEHFRLGALETLEVAVQDVAHLFAADLGPAASVDPLCTKAPELHAIVQITHADAVVREIEQAGLLGETGIGRMQLLGACCDEALEVFRAGALVAEEAPLFRDGLGELPDLHGIERLL